MLENNTLTSRWWAGRYCTQVRDLEKQWIMRSEEEQQNLRLHNSDFIVRKVQSSKIHFYTVEESTKEIFIGTKILAAEFSVLSILRQPLRISSHLVFFAKSHV